MIAAPEDVDEAVGVDAGQVGRAHVSLIADLRRTDLEHPFGVDAEHLAGVGVDDAQVISGLDPADAALLGVPEPLVIRHVPPGHRSAELGGRIGDENPGSVAGEELVAIGGVERRGATHDRTQTRQIGGVGVRLEHHAQRSGNEGGGRRAMTTDQIDPPVDVESFEHRERAPVVHRQQHAKQPAEMGERRVHQGNPPPKLWLLDRSAGLVVLRPDQHVFEGGVTQVDALGRSRRAARQHAYGDSGALCRHRRLAGGPGHGDACAEIVHRDGDCLRRTVHIREVECRQIVGGSDEDAEVESGHILAGALRSTPRIDRHHAPAGTQHAEHRADDARAGAQQHAHLHPGSGLAPGSGLTPGLAHRITHGVDGRREVTPRVPTPVELDGVGVGTDAQDGVDAFGDRRLGHRIRGVVMGSGFAFTSAMPTGLPTRV